MLGEAGVWNMCVVLHPCGSYFYLYFNVRVFLVLLEGICWMKQSFLGSDPDRRHLIQHRYNKFLITAYKERLSGFCSLAGRVMVAHSLWRFRLVARERTDWLRLAPTAATHSGFMCPGPLRPSDPHLPGGSSFFSFHWGQILDPVQLWLHRVHMEQRGRCEPGSRVICEWEHAASSAAVINTWEPPDHVTLSL